MIDADLSHYGLWIQAVNIERDEFSTPGLTKTTVNIVSMSHSPTISLEQFASDMTVMNKVRASQDPAVKEAYEQMLTVMALTNNRDVPKYAECEDDAVQQATVTRSKTP